jgi:hypothetical protein
MARPTKKEVQRLPATMTMKYHIADVVLGKGTFATVKAGTRKIDGAQVLGRPQPDFSTVFAKVQKSEKSKMDLQVSTQHYSNEAFLDTRAPN